MKKRTLFLTLMLSSIFVSTWFTRVYALDTNDSQKAEVRLENKFNVSDARIDSLRRQGLGYGEIDHTLSLAKQLPGGINDQNVNKIVALRQGGEHREGWGEIAHDLNLKEERAEQGENRHESTEGSEERAERGENRHESTEGSAEARTHAFAGGSREGFEGHESAGFNANTGFHGGGGGIGHDR